MYRAQASSEYIIIVGFVVGITIPLMLVYFTFANNVNDQIISAQLEQISKSIKVFADTGYFLGEPSQTTLKVYLPTGIQSVQIINKAINYKIRTGHGINDIVFVSSSDLTGVLPTSSGIHFITVKAEGGGVRFSYT